MFYAKHYLNRFNIGRFGEGIACAYLGQKGWTILKQNHKERSDEIDIIARDKEGVLVFCEVKTLIISTQQKSGNLMPEDNLSQQKLRKLCRVCQFFARKYPHLTDEEKGWRIDLVAVELSDERTVKNIRHYEGIA